LVVPISLLDADPWLLGVENGTVDLRSGELLLAQREHYITMVAPVTFDRSADCPVFLQFLNEIMGGNEELVSYLQRLIGYMLTGSNEEQRLFFLYGTGANGKSTLLNVCKGILGNELCRQTQVDTIMAKTNRSGPTPEVACLKGARAVMTTEVDEGSFLSESLVKQLTGGDPVSARHLYCAPFEFVPSFKLFVAGNHKPVIRGGDEGIWRRIDLIPFTLTIPPEERDQRLGDKLREELPGILNWAIAGCQQWQQRGLDSPAAVLEAVGEYKEDMDVIGQWLDARCDLGAEHTTFGGDAYFSYKMWADNAGLRPLSLPSFGRKLKERFEAKRISGGYRYAGFRPRGIMPSIPRADVKPLVAACRDAAASA
jgi:putative DNA primase/helicase